MILPAGPEPWMLARSTLCLLANAFANGLDASLLLGCTVEDAGSFAYELPPYALELDCGTEDEVFSLKSEKRGT